MKTRTKIIEYFFIGLALILLFMLVNRYLLSRLDVKKIAATATSAVKELKPEARLVCPDGEVKIVLPDGEICRAPVSPTDNEADVYLRIFDTYPKSGGGKEIIYDFLDQGDLAIANDFLNNQIDIERYQPVKFQTINWDEDPYGERYWKFLFYSLRETRHLLAAYRETGDQKYADKFKEIIESFIDDGMAKPLAWDDYHAVAYRAMVLTNAWWKLREADLLTLKLNEKILKAVEKHGDFMLDESHYQSKYNHGTNQASALLLLGANFPDLDRNGSWLATAKKRINEGIATLIDDDGILIENSPYYHFYVLEKYWGLKKYFSKYNIPTETVFSQRLESMVDYAVHILKPNLKVPILGASLERTVGNQGIYGEIAADFPEFAYVLTQGRTGIRPASLNKYYPIAGQVILRSGWGEKTKFKNEFAGQTQVIFDVGPYRTDHSDLDAMSFDLYSGSQAIITDTGLFTYDFTNKLKAYFHGTRGHNTVLVDGRDQRYGSPLPGDFQSGDGYAYYSAQHNLYPQTYHQRGLALIGSDLVIIVDRLFAREEHDYEQLFHLAPGLVAENQGSRVIVKNQAGETVLAMEQLLADGLETNLGDPANDPDNNLCSLEYQKTVPCQTIDFKKRARNLTLITLLKIGPEKIKTTVNSLTEERLSFAHGDYLYTLKLNSPDNDFFSRAKVKMAPAGDLNLKLTAKDGGWELTGQNSENFIVEPDKEGLVKIGLKAGAEKLSAPLPNYYTAEINGLGAYASTNKKIFTHLPYDSREENFKIYEQEDYLPIFGYHNVLPDDQPIVAPASEIHLADFEKQINYATNVMGCRWFTLGDLLENYILKEKKLPRRACAINFDDGRKNNFIYAYPILKKYGAVATFYIITGYALENRPTYMNPDDLDELYRQGNEIGAHTVSHQSLTDSSLSAEQIIYELTESKKQLENQGYSVKTFAYPRGEQNEKIVQLVKGLFLGARDTNKDNTWRDMRPSVVGFTDDYLWHLHYYKPELNSLDELNQILGYNNFWQFEEWYRAENDPDADIAALPSYRPTATSYALVSLPDAGDKIANKFLISHDDNYTLEAFMAVNAAGQSDFPAVPSAAFYLDGQKFSPLPGPSDECQVYRNQYYCYYQIQAFLKSGVHTLAVEAGQSNLKLDKFRIYRQARLQSAYDLNLKSFKSVPPETFPAPLNLRLEKTAKPKINWPLAIWLIILGALSIFSLIKIRKKL